MPGNNAVLYIDSKLIIVVVLITGTFDIVLHIVRRKELLIQPLTYSLIHHTYRHAVEL